MNIEVPDFLIEMSKQLHEQDNRITAEPIFEVRCKRYLVTQEGYNQSHWALYDRDSDGWATYSTEDGFDNSNAHHNFYESNPDWCDDWLECEDLPSGIESFANNFDFEARSSCFYDWPDDCNSLFLQETEETIKSCLTEADAKAFIARKQHDYPKLYIYVSSMVFCPQMIELRNWIMSLKDVECSQ